MLGGKDCPVDMKFYSLGRGKTDRHMEPFFVEIMPSTCSERKLSSHEGEEFIVVHDGAIEVTYGRGDVAAVHLLSHGSEGEVRLGGSVLNAETAGLHAAELGSWGEALGPDGDFLLYGCNAAAGPDGVSFVATLSALTGADVAASDDATGAAALGGDWDLEHAVGSVQARTLSPGSYSGLMTGFTGTSADENFTGTAAADTQDPQTRVLRKVSRRAPRRHCSSPCPCGGP